MQTTPTPQEPCPGCGGALLAVLYYDADGAPIGGHRVCTSCGPRLATDVEIAPAELRRQLLERKAS